MVYLPTFILLLIPLVMGQPTPTELAFASSSGTSLISSSISHKPPSSTPTPNFVGNHSHSVHPASAGKHQKRAGMDDYLWMSGILRVIDQGVNRQDQKDDDGLAKVVNSISRSVEGEIKVDDMTSTGVTAGKAKRRRRRRSHP